MTTQALVAILARKNEDAEVSVSAWQVNEFFKQEFQRISLTLDLQCQDGSCFKWDVCRPDLMLAYFCSESSHFRDAMLAATTEAGGEHLGAILYLDEVVPGNILKPENKRTFWAVYFSFLQFGADRLFRTEFWLPLAILRSSVAMEVVGGMSRCMRELVRAILFEPCNMAQVGVALQLPAPTLVRWSIAKLIGDEAALKTVWLSKGAAGIRPCLFCANVVSRHSDLSENPSLVDIGCSDPSQFVRVSDQDMWDSFDNLASQKDVLNRREFAILERASGSPRRTPPCRATVCWANLASLRRDGPHQTQCERQDTQT